MDDHYNPAAPAPASAWDTPKAAGAIALTALAFLMLVRRGFAGARGL